MADPIVGTNEHPIHAQPRSLRVIGWLSVVAGAWSIGDEVIRLLRGPDVGVRDSSPDSALAPSREHLLGAQRYLVLLAP
jgi:hypothetical protein